MRRTQPLLLGLILVSLILATFSSPTPSAAQALVPPTFGGWAGRCGAGAGCDTSNAGNKHTFGFTCSAACTPDTFTFGSGDGQFFNPTAVALGSNNDVYV